MISSKFTSYLYAIALLCLTLNISSAQVYYASGFPRAVLNYMSSRESRYHHYLWHNIRDNWNTYDSDTQQEIRQRGWEPPNPARSFDESGNPSAITDNYSGEDFLYMHQKMIERAKSLVGYDPDAYDRLTGWSSIPGPNDNDFPVPPEYQIEGSSSLSDVINSRKSDDFYYSQMVRLENLFTNPDELRSMTLSQLGSRIENTIHNWLHLRFSEESRVGYRSGGSEPFPYIDERWDNRGYNWLADTYSSHVNPVFWKLHGWIDDRIEDWKNANGISEIQWMGTWEGGPMDAIMDLIAPQEQMQQMAEEDEGMNSAEGETSMNVNVDIGGEVTSSFADDVQVDF